MAGSSSTAKSTIRAKASTTTSKKTKPKEKLFHPLSRKAAQLERAHLRQHKLTGAKSHRSKLYTIKSDRYVFFHHALPPDVPSISLPEIHELIRDIWLHRLDAQLAEEEASRRKGDPRTTKADKLIAQMEADKEEYRAGLEIPDLTDPITFDLLRKWEDGDPAYLSLLRFVRVSSSNPEMLQLVRRGGRELELEGKAIKEAKMEQKLNPSAMMVD